MRVGIAYFSGTGNTRLVSIYLAGLINAEPFSIERRMNVSEYDVLILAFPIYGFDAPEPFWRFLESVDTPKPFFLICTMALTDGGTRRRIRKYLESMGWRYLGGFKVRMVGTDLILTVGKNSSSARRLKRRFWSWKKKVEIIAKKIRRGLEKVDEMEAPEPVERRKRRKSSKIRKVLFGFLSRGLYADERCDLCGVCEKICPESAIEIEERVVFHPESCILCLRCIHHCPRESIQLTRFSVGKLRWRDLVDKN